MKYTICIFSYSRSTSLIMKTQKIPYHFSLNYFHIDYLLWRSIKFIRYLNLGIKINFFHGIIFRKTKLFFINHLKYKFKEPLDSPERTLKHGELIRKKKFLNNLYKDWYNIFLRELPNLPSGKLIELGSGGGFIKTIEPTIITSDILALPNVDMNFSALEMPFEKDEVGAIFMIDTFHHIPNAEKFLTEALRVLKNGGRIIMIEPANSIWGRFIYKNFHHEPFEINAGWDIPHKGPLSGANGALPWIVFERDKNRLYQQFPELKVQSIKYHTPLLYLVSGGVSYKQLIPSFLYIFFKVIDKILPKINKHFSMFVTIDIQKC